ncbi:transcriptional regulator, TetR family [Leptospira broomii serovar Hurstbridge str. 5399]|uniref:Transcriptional regulator, TetR family n=1 Tax=Leptospira broomii serovar Hurstbridge str. 5399 TaxID=1049789 RepID=T0GKJ4_9LEPT|nr:TetR/AcrR family transcriptional regulator [Leptospira broomii]EQA47304.1 transcriptional regulator, TetR family [Leptospira broomii serovar Hurstbridge str. 5399]
MKKKIRTPTQSRSRERVELILRTARDLIGKRGIDSVSMREIAQAAGVQIGSLYQYFPGKNQLLLTIMQEYYDRLYEGTKSLLERVRTISELEIAAEKALKQYIHLFQTDPALTNIWAGIRAVPELGIEDDKDTYRNAELMVKTAMRCFTGLRESDLRPFALYFSYSIGSITRLAAETNNEHNRGVIRECREVLHLRLEAFQKLSETRKQAKTRKTNI